MCERISFLDLCYRSWRLLTRIGEERSGFFVIDMRVGKKDLAVAKKW